MSNRQNIRFVYFLLVLQFYLVMIVDVKYVVIYTNRSVKINISIARMDMIKCPFHQVLYTITIHKYTYLAQTILSLQQLFNCIYPNPPCQLSLWEETGAPEKGRAFKLYLCILDSREMKVDFSWAHTTQTMAVGYMALRDQTPEVCHVIRYLYILTNLNVITLDSTIRSLNPQTSILFVSILFFFRWFRQTTTACCRILPTLNTHILKHDISLQFQLTKLEADVSPGSSVSTQGIVQTQQLPKEENSS